MAEATGGKDLELVVAALLHDAIEDAGAFGEDVAKLVEEVTDDKTIEKWERKKLQVKDAHKKSHRAKIIKLAEKTSNLRSLAASPPPDWSVKRRLEYIEWARNVAKGLTGVSDWLPRWSVDEILAGQGEEFIVELLQSQLTAERYKELDSKIDLREGYKTGYANLLGFLTGDEKLKIEEYNMEQRYEDDKASACYCYAYNTIKAPDGKELTFQALIEDDGTCTELKTPYDERDGNFTDFSACLGPFF